MALRLINTSTHQFETFIGGIRSKVPAYAILSHTWESDGEVSFQEMMAIGCDSSHPAIEKSGYRKIGKVCEKAKDDDIAYAWVDTCCIDKTNNSELSEAINSMFRWYQQAKVCYVYLSDVDTTLTTFESALPECRWLTRGWCLQELLAPKIVDIFDANWQHVASKANSTRLISMRAGIEEEVLMDSSLIPSVPVARKMSWASGRRTTRDEDMAYCLLGIFDINMPMLYGEGTKAFLRLQEQIMMRSNDLSIFAFQHTPTPEEARVSYCDLFAASPEGFKDCKKLKCSSIDVHSNDPFAMTNKGLYFRRGELHIDFRNGLYSILLNCDQASFDCSRMYLQKVGPGLYARCNSNYATVDEYHYTRIEEEVYIVSLINASVLHEFEAATDFAIHVGSHTHNLSKALQVLVRSPWSNFWDLARMQCLTRGERPFRCFWKLFPSLARELGDKGILPRSFSKPIYLACGLEYPEKSSTSSDAKPWVSLYSGKEWGRLAHKYGIITGRYDVAGLFKADEASSHASLRTEELITITASIELEAGLIRPRFELNLDLEF